MIEDSERTGKWWQQKGGIYFPDKLGAQRKANRPGVEKLCAP